jgi:hypothetical protein
MTKEQERALQNLEIASRDVKKCLGMKQGGAGAEKKYSQAYQECVRVGALPQIRAKYR